MEITSRVQAGDLVVIGNRGGLKAGKLGKTQADPLAEWRRGT